MSIPNAGARIGPRIILAALAVVIAVVVTGLLLVGMGWGAGADGPVSVASSRPASPTISSDGPSPSPAPPSGGSQPPTGASPSPVSGASLIVGSSASPAPSSTAGTTAAPSRAPTTAPTVVATSPTIAPSPTVVPTVIGPPPVTIAPPTATPLVDKTGPELSRLSASRDYMYIPTVCGPNYVDIAVVASDPSGVSSVTLWYRPPGGTLFISKAMGLLKGTALSGAWSARVTTTSGWSAGAMAYYVTALDEPGNSTRLPPPKAILPAINVIGLCVIR